MGDLCVACLCQSKRRVELIEPVRLETGRKIRKDRKIRKEMEPLVRGPFGGRDLSRGELPLKPCLRRLVDKREQIRLGFEVS